VRSEESVGKEAEREKSGSTTADAGSTG